MERQAVDPASIRPMGYDPERDLLEIEFQSGEVYDYFDVPEETWVGLSEADSRGRYFLENIRDLYGYQEQS